MAPRPRGPLTILRSIPWKRFGAGVVAGAVGLTLTFLLRLLGLGVFLPELAVDFAIVRIPGSVESFFIRTMGGGAKVLALVTAIAVFLAISGLYATFFRWVQSRTASRIAVVGVYTVVPAAIALFVSIPILDGGILGTRTSAGPWAAAFSQILGSWLYAAVLDYLLVDVAARHPEGFSLSRRQFITAAALASAALLLAVYGLSSLVTRTGRLAFASVADMFRKEVTPNEEFYVVTKNVIDPEVDVGAWRLEIDGLVSTPVTLTYPDLIDRMSTDEFVTFECVSNEVGGNLISTALWSGVRLADLMGVAGPNPEADWVAFTCADGYTVGIPRGRAMRAETLLALEMNGVTLPSKHGFPARVVVPGLYGMFDAKWVTRISLVRGEFLGFWQEKGWTNLGTVRTTAIIATPSPDSVVGRTVEIGGVAFAGDRGISKVEVSTDGGTSWLPATLSPPRSGLAWTLWTFRWTASATGAYRVVARAIDANSTPQDSKPSPPYPAGATGYDAILLYVSD